MELTDYKKLGYSFQLKENFNNASLTIWFGWFKIYDEIFSTHMANWTYLYGWDNFIVNIMKEDWRQRQIEKLI